MKELRKYIRKVITESLMENIQVYRGGTKQWDTFDMDKVGTGDGGTLGGWGIYCSDSLDVANRYFLKNGQIKEFDIKDGPYFDLDEPLDEGLAIQIMEKLRKKGIDEDELEQFQTDYIDYIQYGDITNNSVYEWLSYIFGNQKEASLFLHDMGYRGNKMKDRWERDATNYILFDPSYVIDETLQENQNLEDLISHSIVPNKKGDVLIKNDDFEAKIDTFGDYYRLYWIKNISRKYSGTEIFKNILKTLSNKFGNRPVSATGIKGEFKGKPVNGYYTMFRWGFIPEGGIDFINNQLGTSYESLEKAVNDNGFWEMWKANGTEIEGIFDMSPGSLSWKILNKI
jgi:hypothetical protein